MVSLINKTKEDVMKNIIKVQTIWAEESNEQWYKYEDDEIKTEDELFELFPEGYVEYSFISDSARVILQEDRTNGLYIGTKFDSLWNSRE